MHALQGREGSAVWAGGREGGRAWAGAPPWGLCGEGEAGWKRQLRTGWSGSFWKVWGTGAVPACLAPGSGGI